MPLLGQSLSNEKQGKLGERLIRQQRNDRFGEHGWFSISYLGEISLYLFPTFFAPTPEMVLLRINFLFQVM